MSHGYIFLPKGTMTKFRILHSIDGPIDDLTVGQICETSGISRQAFYSHFKSKYDVPYWLFDLANDLYVSKIGRELSWEEGYREAFAFIHDEREHLMHCFAENPLDHEVEPYLEKQRKELVATLTDYKRRTVGDELMFYVDFLVYKGNELVVDWCRGGVPPSPEQLYERFTNCAPHKLYEILKQPTVSREQSR